MINSIGTAGPLNRDHVPIENFSSFKCIDSSGTMSSLISAVAWVRKGVSAQHPHKYVLDDKELERVSALARIELEDARVELERAHEAAKTMGRGGEGEEADDQEDEDNWVESVCSPSSPERLSIF
jgi:hypothetical protein